MNKPKSGACMFLHVIHFPVVLSLRWPYVTDSEG